MHQFFNNFFLFCFFSHWCLCYYASTNFFGGVCQGGGPVLLQRLLRSGSCVENAKCWLSLWHGEVKGPSHWESVHMSPFCFLKRGALPHLLLSAPPTTTTTNTTTFHFLIPLPSYFIQQSMEKRPWRGVGLYFIKALRWSSRLTTLTLVLIVAIIAANCLQMLVFVRVADILGVII